MAYARHSDKDSEIYAFGSINGYETQVSHESNKKNLEGKYGLIAQKKDFVILYYI